MNRTTVNQRMQTLAKYILGHAVSLVNADATHLYFRVGEHVFADQRLKYPSEKLLANLSLAVEAEGFSRNAFDIGELDDKTVGELTYHGRYSPDQVHWALADARVA